MKQLYIQSIQHVGMDHSCLHPPVVLRENCNKSMHHPAIVFYISIILNAFRLLNTLILSRFYLIPPQGILQ